MSGALAQVAAAVRSRSLAFGFLIAQTVLGLMVVSHALVLSELFQKQQVLPGADMDGSFCVTSEDDDPSLAAADLKAMERLPGVRAAAWVSNTPFQQRRLPGTFASGDRSVRAWEMYGTSEMAAAYGFELEQGRALAPGDATAAGERPVLISASLSRVLFGTSAGLGRTFSSLDSDTAFRVVGILRQAAVTPAISILADQLVVQVAEPPRARRSQYMANVAPPFRAGFAVALEAALRPSAPRRFLRVESLRAGMERVFLARTGSVIIFSILIALVLGVVVLGSAGMSAYLVAERMREIGVRRAMGARRRDIAGYFLFESLSITTLGLLLGCAVSLAMNRWLVQRALPYVALDFRHLFLGFILFWVTGLLAASMPALRASRIPPSVASRTA